MYESRVVACELAFWARAHDRPKTKGKSREVPKICEEAFFFQLFNKRLPRDDHRRKETIKSSSLFFQFRILHSRSQRITIHFERLRRERKRKVKQSMEINFMRRDLIKRSATNAPHCEDYDCGQSRWVMIFWRDQISVFSVYLEIV